VARQLATVALQDETAARTVSTHDAAQVLSALTAVSQSDDVRSA